MKPKKKSAKKKATASPRTKPASRAKKKVATKKKAAKAGVSPPPEAAPKVKKLKSVTKALAKKVPRKVAEIVASKPVITKTAVPDAAPQPEVLKVSAKPAAKIISSKRSTTKKVSPAAAAKPVRRKAAVQKPVLYESLVPRTLEMKQLPAKAPVRKAPANIPPILFEGDKPGNPPASGPGHRYALGPASSIEKLEAEGELPEAYGTQQLLLTARDPHWLYAHWDLTSAQQRHYNARSRDRHLVLRIYQNVVSGRAVQEVHVHPESRHWFVHVNRAGVKYLAELGCYQMQGSWMTIATSGATLTPPDSVSEDTSAEFATIPFELPMAKLLSLVKEAVQENVPLAEALVEILTEGHSSWPDVVPNRKTVSTPALALWTPKTEWTPTQEAALAGILSMDSVRRVWMGSLEITELIRRQMVQELASMSAANLGGQGVPPSSPLPAGAISSPPGGRKPSEKGFWFNVNAELIIYGATESDATVTIAGRTIRLRPDGSFSYRFALPDGQYELPVVAVSADQTDGRAAELVFSRSTEIRGDVGAHPQEPELKRPEAASL